MQPSGGPPSMTSAPSMPRQAVLWILFHPVSWRWHLHSESDCKLMSRGGGGAPPSDEYPYMVRVVRRRFPTMSKRTPAWQLELPTSLSLLSDAAAFSLSWRGLESYYVGDPYQSPNSVTSVRLQTLF